MKSAKEILTYAIEKDYANKYTEMELYINIPKHNDDVELLDAVCESYCLNKNNVAFISTNFRSHHMVRLSGYDSFYLYDILHYKNRNTLEDRAIIYKQYLNPLLNGAYDVVIVQSIDHLKYEEVKELRRILQVRANVKVIYCYDSNIVKDHMGVGILENIWRYTNYAVSKIGRDRLNTSDTLYKLKNRIRDKSFDMNAFLAENLSQPFLTIHKTQELDLDKYINTTIPIITPHPTLFYIINDYIRNKRGLTEDIDTAHIPRQYEPLMSPFPVKAYIKSTGEQITIGPGTTIHVQDVHIIDDNSATIDFLHIDINSEDELLCSAKISLSWIRKIMNNVSGYKLGYLGYIANSRVISNEFNDDPSSDINYMYFAYAKLARVVAPTESIANATVIYDPRLSSNKDDLYTAIVSVQSELTLVKIINSN